MGFGMSKSKVTRKQEEKSELAAKRSKNKSLLTKEAVRAIESEPKWKSVLVLPQFRQDQRAEGEAVKGPEMMYGKDAIMNVVDFEHGGSLLAWNNAKEPGRTQTAGSNAGKFETLVPSSNLLGGYDLRQNEQLEIRELEEVENWRTMGKDSFPELLKDHVAPSLSRKFDEGERLASTERTAAGATGDEGGSYENSMQNAAAFAIPQMVPRTVTIGYVTAGYLGVGESASQANGMPDIECVAKGDSLAKSTTDKSEKKTTSQTRVEVRSKDEGPDQGAAVPEKFTGEGMSEGKGHSEVEKKDVPGAWVDSSAYFCSCSESCPAKADCGGDFIVGFAHDFGRHDLISTAAKKLDNADDENVSFMKKSLEEIGLIPLCTTVGPMPDSSAIGKLSELARLQMARDAFPLMVESRAEPQDIQELHIEEPASPNECPDPGNQGRMGAEQANDGGENVIELNDDEAEEDAKDQEDDLSNVGAVGDSSVTDGIQPPSGINSLATGDLDSNESCPKWSDVDEKWNDSEAIGGPQAMRDESMFTPEEHGFRSSHNFAPDI